MGPMLITAALANGATGVLFEGVPDHPKPDRLWALVARHRISVMGLSPTATCELMPHGSEHPRRHDLASLRILGSTGEPESRALGWLFEQVGGGRLPILNYTGGTEISGGILGCFPITPSSPAPSPAPFPAWPPTCLTTMAGRCASRWAAGDHPSVAGDDRGLLAGPARYEETYWARWPDVWVHGDWAVIDADGFWFLQGRSDDTLKIAGKRLGPAEVESILVGHPAVAGRVSSGSPTRSRARRSSASSCSSPARARLSRCAPS